ncbi:MAG: hypothetical protein NC305_18640 [Lachnospiraceae bacterium]|nr:hypothetical protein [Lachnospiraceae bacterium]
MKKFIRSRGFLISVLAAACIGILATCLIVNREQKSNFQPEEIFVNAGAPETSPTPPPAAATRAPATATPAPAATKDPLEGYPRVVEESGEGVVIDFTPEGGSLQPETPEPPKAEGDAADPSAPPVYPPETTEPEEAAPPAQDDSTPAPGSTNGNGAVYDPVFGWVVPSPVEQTTSDSNGDPDKMVGDM